MGQSIVQIKQMGDALRSSGYKSIDSAVAEIIDNSIEAGAHDIFVIMSEHVDPSTGRKTIYEFGILDNGSGMDTYQLASCLGIGYTTKSNRKGMGRFGVGLPQASLHVTPNVEVYSWTDDINEGGAYKVWLDINKVKTGEQEEIDDPVPDDIPTQYVKFLKYKASLLQEFDFTKHGTLVYWKNCDNIKPKTMSSLNEKLEVAIGRKFRHLINDKTHNIRLITIGHEEQAIDVLPNDPLMLMTPNYVLGNLNNPGEISRRANVNCTEPIFETFNGDKAPNGVATIMVQYFDKIDGVTKDSPVEIAFSKVRPEFYDQTAFPSSNPGSSELGKHVKTLEGISVVRAGREIDFGSFNFYDKENNPFHRWWGCEIRFNPVLDELFGVANNKQQVELHDDRTDKDDDAEESLWDKLAAIIKPTIAKMVESNKELRKDTRTTTNDSADQSESERIIEKAENELGEEIGQAQNERQTVSEEEMKDRAREKLIEQGVENPTNEQIKALLDKEVSIKYSNIGRNGPFLDTDFSLGNVSVTINTAHIFYNEFINNMSEDSRTAFELFIGALAQAINKTNIHNCDQNDQLLQEWDHRLKTYLQKIKNG